MLSKRKIEKLGVKTSPRLFEPKWSTSELVGVQGYQKDPPSLIYPKYLRLPSSNYQWTSQSLVFTSYPDPAIRPDCIYQASSASFGNFPKLLKLQNTLYTLNMCGLCFGTNPFSRYDNRREMQTQDNTKTWPSQVEIDPLVNKLEYKDIKKTLQA